MTTATQPQVEHTYNIVRIPAPRGISKYCVVQPYTARYMDKFGVYGSPMFAATFETMAEAEAAAVKFCK